MVFAATKVLRRKSEPQMRDFVTVAALCLAVFVALAVPPGLADEEARSEGRLFGQLARERSLSESYVGLLNEFGPKDAGTYAEGIRLYAVAKADFDGLIEQLKNDMINGRKLDQSKAYKDTLRTAVERRIAFTAHIDEKVIGDDTGQRSGIIAALTSVAELLAALTKVGEAIWGTYRDAQTEHRKEILDQLDGLKWKAFHEIGSGRPKAH